MTEEEKTRKIERSQVAKNEIFRKNAAGSVTLYPPSFPTTMNTRLSRCLLLFFPVLFFCSCGPPTEISGRDRAYWKDVVADCEKRIHELQTEIKRIEESIERKAKADGIEELIQEFQRIAWGLNLIPRLSPDGGQLEGHFRNTSNYELAEISIRVVRMLLFEIIDEETIPVRLEKHLPPRQRIDLSVPAMFSNGETRNLADVSRAEHAPFSPIRYTVTSFITSSGETYDMPLEHIAYRDQIERKERILNTYEFSKSMAQTNVDRLRGNK
ncbi:MAG: hypothetical protein WD490_11080 [Opitutales bacterium]